MPSDQAAAITVYVLAGCPHCARALSLLGRRGLTHDVVCGDGESGFRGRLQTLTGGLTVPQIVIDGRPIGGAAQLARLDRRGVLDALAFGEALPVIRVRRRRLRRPASRWVAEAFDATGVRVAGAAGPDADTVRERLMAPAAGTS